MDVDEKIVTKSASNEVAAVMEDEPHTEIHEATTQPLADSAAEVVPAVEVPPGVEVAVLTDPTPTVETQASTPAAAGIKEDDFDPQTSPLAQLSELGVSPAAVKVVPKVAAVPKTDAADSAPAPDQLPGKHGTAFGSRRRVWNDEEINLINWAEVKQPASLELKPPMRKDFNCELLPMTPVSSIKEAFGRFPEVLVRCHEIGLISPSPLQSEVWPYLLAGKDVLCISETGIRDPMSYL